MRFLPLLPLLTLLTVALVGAAGCQISNEDGWPTAEARILIGGGNIIARPDPDPVEKDVTDEGS
ncbi:MAG: hypothetical protein ACF8MF_06925 [Phycisphaerales bacterium JB052]